MKASLQIRIKAFFIHFLLSIFIISIFLFVVTQIWYPGALFEIENVWEALNILIPVDAVLGPILTFLLYVPGKKGLKFDLFIIAFFQLSALVYGGSLIYQQRPALIAFIVDRFEVIPASTEFISSIPMDRFQNTSYPIMTYVLPPQTVEERNHYILTKDKFDLEGHRYFPITESLQRVKERALDINLINYPSVGHSIFFDDFNFSDSSSKGLLLLPIQSSDKESVIVGIDPKSGKIKKYFNIDPYYGKINRSK